MKRLLKRTILMCALIGLLPLCSTSAADLRIATVDLNKTFTNYWKTVQAGNILQDRRNTLGEEFKTLMEQGQKIKAEYDKAVEEANDVAASTEERDRRKKAVVAKQTELNDIKRSTEQFDAAAKSNLSEQHRRMRDNVLGEIRAAINVMAKASGYDLVVDTSAESQNNQTAIFIFVSSKNDLTEALLAELNKDAPPGIFKQARAQVPKKEEK